ncbi:MAG: GDP-L-fucose synthase family protein [Stellaceae bacterium]
MTLGNPLKLQGKKVWVAGHRGLVGSALLRRLQSEDCEILTVDHSMLDLRRGDDVEAWVSRQRPDIVLLAAARVGGILANSMNPADFIHDNLMIQSSVIEASHHGNVEKLVFLGSSCIYPRLAAQPIVEEALLTGPLEPTNQWYAIAKIAGIKMCEAYRRQYGNDFVSVMPTNLYGPGDNFDSVSAHVIPALIGKIHRAKVDRARSVEIWGSGRPFREFLHVDDAADAIIFVLKHYSGDAFLNICAGSEISIGDLSREICHIVGFDGEIRFDASKPDGTPRKLVDISRIAALGWKPHISLADGLAETYRCYTKHLGPDLRGTVLDPV